MNSMVLEVNTRHKDDLHRLIINLQCVKKVSNTDIKLCIFDPK
jgi:hypothetical protein